MLTFFWGEIIIYSSVSNTLGNKTLPAPFLRGKGTMAKQPVPTASKRAVRPNLFRASRSARRFSNNLVASVLGNRVDDVFKMASSLRLYDILVGGSSFHIAIQLNMK